MLLLIAVLNILVRNANPRGPMGLCGCYLDLVSCYLCFVLFVVCNVISLYVFCCFVNEPVCFMCCMSNSVCELFGETIRNVCGCSCYFVVECYGCV